MALKIVEEIDQSWSIVDIAEKRPSAGWEEVFQDCLPEFRDLDEDLKGQEFYPLKKHLFRAFDLTPLSRVSVVIIGQDPYPQMIMLPQGRVPRAQGLSFSVHKEDAIPASLKNIYKELQNTVTGFQPPMHGDLSYWAYQGVLLLNSCLTVRPNEPGSHGQMWMGFVTKVLQAINEKRPGTVFILWGKQAQELESLVGERAKIIKGAHPSPLSANRGGFFGGNYFNLANRLLQQMGRPLIDWNVPF